MRGARPPQWVEYRKAAIDAGQRGEASRADFAAQRAHELEKHLSRVQIVLAIGDHLAELHVDGQVVPIDADLAFFQDAGPARARSRAR